MKKNRYRPNGEWHRRLRCPKCHWQTDWRCPECGWQGSNAGWIRDGDTANLIRPMAENDLPDSARRRPIQLATEVAEMRLGEGDALGDARPSERSLERRSLTDEDVSSERKDEVEREGQAAASALAARAADKPTKGRVVEAALGDPTVTREQKDLLRAALDHPILTAKQTTALAVRVREGDEGAMQELVRCNVRLVAWVIVREFPRRENIPFEDLVQEGMVGVARAARTWDPKTARFSTYAYWWICDSVGTYLRGARSVVRPKSHTTAEWDESLNAPVYFDSDGNEKGEEIEGVEEPSQGPEVDCSEARFRERVLEIRPAIVAEHGELGWEVVWEHCLGEPKVTLEEIGERRGVSRQYVRKVKRKVEQFLRQTIGVEAMQPPELPPAQRRRRARRQVAVEAPEGVAAFEAVA